MPSIRLIGRLELVTTALVALPIIVFGALFVGGAMPVEHLAADYFAAAIGMAFLGLYATALHAWLRGKGRDAADAGFLSKMFALAMLLVSATVTASGAWVSHGVTLGNVSLCAFLSIFAAWVGYRMVAAGERKLAKPAL